MSIVMKNRILMNQATAEGSEGGTGTLLTQSVSTPPPSSPPPAAAESAAPPAPPKVEAAKTWLDEMPAEFKESDTLKRYKSVKDLAAAYLSAQKFISADKIPVPSKHATPEEWQKVFNKLGVPEKVEEYNISIDEKLGFDKTFAEEYKKQAHALGILPHQAQQIIEWAGKFSNDAVQKQVQTFDSQQATALEGLKKEWGSAYDAKLGQAAAVIQQYGDDSLREYLNKTKLGNDVNLIKLLSSVGEKLNMEGTIVDAGSSTNKAHTPEQAMAEINKIMGDRNHPYYDKSHPGHKAAVDEMALLFKQAHPSSKELKFRGAR